MTISRKVLHADSTHSIGINPDAFTDEEWEAFTHHCRERGFSIGAYTSNLIREVLGGRLEIGYQVRRDSGA